MTALARSTLLGRRLRRRRPKPLRALREPRAEQLRYTAALRRVVARTVALVRAELLPRLPALVNEAASMAPRTDGLRLDDAAEQLGEIIEAIMAALDLSEAAARRMALEMLERVQRGHADAFVTAYEDSLAVNPLAGAEPWLRDQVAIAVKENARLIKSLSEQLLTQVESVVNRGALEGLRHEDIAKQLVERFGVAESRATLIARDQTLKWHGSLTRLRQLDAGVTEYEWSTSRDERVRKTHRARDGKRYKWDKFPVPGQEVNCRCAAIPVIPDEEAEEVETYGLEAR